ncbi:MAG: hypothetical protein QOG85_2530 [Gaiellaceae bacterium]|nr:hypothetical protein [Gaiellaceae bacterium]
MVPPSAPSFMLAHNEPGSRSGKSAVFPPRADSGAPTALLQKGIAQRVWVYVIREPAPPVDLNDGDPLAVLRLECRVAVDGDLAQCEPELVACRIHDTPRRLAEMAAGRAVERDLRQRYGYIPRVTVASATRCTASPYAATRIGRFRSFETAQVSSNALLMMSLSFAFTSTSFQKYSWSP